MKKTIRVKVVSLLMLAVLLGCLGGCTSKEAKSVIKKIDQVGEFDISTGTMLKQIELEYEALSDEDKAQVENYSEFETMVDEYDTFMRSELDDIYYKLSYYSYNERNLYKEELFAFYDYMTDDQKRECLSLYLFYEEAPAKVEAAIKNSLKNPSSFVLYDMDVDSVITYDEEDDEYTGFIDVVYGGTNSFGGMVKESDSIWVDFSIDIETKDFYVEDITMWGF